MKRSLAMRKRQATTIRTYKLDPPTTKASYALENSSAIHIVAPSERELMMDQPWLQIISGGAIAFAGLMWLGEIEASSKRELAEEDLSKTGSDLDPAGTPTKTKRRAVDWFRPY